ncbi:MAG: hypothetical protein RLZZ111_1894 [Planctomycetota bacterium]|jgi:hypothetical protein
MSEALTVSPALESKIMKLHSRMEQTVAQGRRRLLTTAIAMGCLLLAASGYLWYLYSKIAEFADARTVVELAAAQVEPQLNLEASRFGDTLEAQAPAVMDQAEKALLAAPPQIARGIEDYTSTFVDKQLSTLESQAYDVASKTLEGSIVKAREQGIDLNDEKQLDALVAAAAPTMRDAVRKALDQLYAEYTTGADNLGGFIERLAVGDGKDLTSYQQTQREILLTGLALIKKMESDPDRAPLQKVIDGRQ